MALYSFQFHLDVLEKGFAVPGSGTIHGHRHSYLILDPGSAYYDDAGGGPLERDQGSRIRWLWLRIVPDSGSTAPCKCKVARPEWTSAMV